ncbi:MAG: hypothetical protein JWR81_4247 [Pseudonocardia sp.]|nr:hypothetical protein [Pseudonocardia sp.]
MSGGIEVGNGVLGDEFRRAGPGVWAAGDAAVGVNSIRSLGDARALVGAPWDTATKGGSDNDRRP